MPDNTTLSDAARLLSPQLLQDARSDTARKMGCSGAVRRCRSRGILPAQRRPRRGSSGHLHSMSRTRSVPGLRDHR
jgi:hypothetical protein